MKNDLQSRSIWLIDLSQNNLIRIWNVWDYYYSPGVLVNNPESDKDPTQQRTKSWPACLWPQKRACSQKSLDQMYQNAVSYSHTQGAEHSRTPWYKWQIPKDTMNMLQKIIPEMNLQQNTMHMLQKTMSEKILQQSTNTIEHHKYVAENYARLDFTTKDQYHRTPWICYIK